MFGRIKILLDFLLNIVNYMYSSVAALNWSKSPDKEYDSDCLQEHSDLFLSELIQGLLLDSIAVSHFVDNFCSV